MTSHSQRGVATLLLTSILLSVALVVTLGMYKYLFFQIKRAQNEVKAKQQFWRAEGGLECVYSLTQTQRVLPSATSYADCSDVAFGYHTPAPGQLAVTATYGYSQLSKTIRYPAPASGVLKATSNLYFAGGLAMRPDPSLSLGESQWGCTMLRYSQDFLVNGALKNDGLLNSDLPYEGYPLGQSCHPDYLTELTATGASTPTGLKRDFVKDSGQTPFEDLFGAPRSDWFEVMADRHFQKIANESLVDGNGQMLMDQSALPTPEIVSDCGDKIAQQISAGHDLLWVYGSCHMDSDDLEAVSTAIDGASSTLDGVILVVHNGLLSTHGSLTFKGMIYHFISAADDGSPDFTPSEDAWKSLNTTQTTNLAGVVDHDPDVVPAVSVSNTAYFQNGAFFPTGGYVMDAPGTYAVFTASMNFTFNRDAIEVPLNKIRQFKWQQGSWHGQ
ncbi:hypothetical protein AMR76_21045 [Vibrio furnissii]|uniref:Type 4 fimbrial biogenesis protein PilX N-terminal domain-containing protein n=1 Tax=Vibrio furnissii TaxID=29494 RepID=A0A0Q2UT86_VIBFU|nr:hypothetical protein [Vibrio furnissii]KQH83800.1 hypothetical protein AMR76_21045 [Vibrio furnissii]